MDEKKQVCPNCGGTGNLSTFHGESRFMLTHEECPFCCGFGYVLEEENGNARKSGLQGGTGRKRNESR